jgi:hypothetical protein
MDRQVMQQPRLTAAVKRLTAAAVAMLAVEAVGILAVAAAESTNPPTTPILML